MVAREHLARNMHIHKYFLGQDGRKHALNITSELGVANMHIRHIYVLKILTYASSYPMLYASAASIIS